MKQTLILKIVRDTCRSTKFTCAQKENSVAEESPDNHIEQLLSLPSLALQTTTNAASWSSLCLGVLPTYMSAIQSTVARGRRTNAVSGSSRLRGDAMASQSPVNR